MRVARFGTALLAAASSLLINSCRDSHPTEPSVLPTRATSTAIQAAPIPEPSVPTRPFHSAGASFWAMVPLGNLTLHGGPVLDHTNTYAIFWGTSWNTDPNFTRDKITSIQTFFAGFGGSNYANILTEYGASNRSAYVATIIDNSAAPSGDPGKEALIAHVCSVIRARGLSPDANAFYAVYSTAKNPPTYVGYHTAGICFLSIIHVALIFNTDLLNDFPDSVYRSSKAEELASITAHELFETITDPDGGGNNTGWFASNTYGEIGDKCAYIPFPTPYITLSNGSVFTVQSEWSNLAFSRRSGYANGNNEPGCILSPQSWPTAIISGPQFSKQYQSVTFSVATTGGTPPYTYYWHFSSSIPTFVLPTGTGQTFTTTQYGSSTGQQEALFASVTDALGKSVTATYLITSSW